MWVPLLTLSLCLAFQLLSIASFRSPILLSPRRFASSSPGRKRTSVSFWLKTPYVELTLFAIQIDETCIAALSQDEKASLKAEMLVANHSWTHVETTRHKDHAWELVILSAADTDMGKTLRLCRAGAGHSCTTVESEGSWSLFWGNKGSSLGNTIKVHIGAGTNCLANAELSEDVGLISDFRLYESVDSEQDLIRMLLRDWTEDIDESRAYEEIMLSKEPEKTAILRKWEVELPPSSQVVSLRLTGFFLVSKIVRGNLLETSIFLGSEYIQITLELSADTSLKLCLHLESDGHGETCVGSKRVSLNEDQRFSIVFCMTSYNFLVKLCCGEALTTGEECRADTAPNTLIEKADGVSRLELSLRKEASWQVGALTLTQSQSCSDSHLLHLNARHLATTLHYSQFAYRQPISQGISQYYTFENNHLGTKYIFAELDNLGSGGDPDLFIQKPYGGVCYWGSSAVGPDSLTIYSYDSQIATQFSGNMQGSYTVRVYGYAGSFDYEIRITVACADTSGGCFCPSGQYANPSTSACSLCPLLSGLCLAAQNSGCVQLTVGTASVPDTFNCYKCDPGVNPCACHHSCPACYGSGEKDCTSCYANAGLAGASPNACVCAQKFYPLLDASSCQACHSYCFNCVSGNDTDCTGCMSNAQLTGIAPTSCQCSSGFVGTPDNCQPCDTTCGTCSAVGSLACDSCKSGAQLVGGSPPSSCECVPGYYTASDASSCQACNSTCKLCSAGGAGNCSDCYPNASLTAGSPSSCACVGGYYGSAGACQACVSPCVTCSAGNSASCMSCATYAHVNGATPGSCVCDTGYFPNPDILNCALCNSYCKTCSSGTASGCTSCWANAGLIGGSSNSCACSTPYVGNPDSCSLCNVSCSTCIGALANQCNTCKTGASISGSAPSTCVCTNGYYGSPASCSTCDATCLACSAAGSSSCTSCKLHASLSSGICICDGGYYPNTTSASCSGCNTTCQTCSGGFATSCTACKANAQLNGAASTDCLCSDGFFPNTTPAICSPCDSTCKTCTAGSSVDCTGCVLNAALVGGTSPGTCACNAGYYPDTTPASCPKCNITCKTCNAGLDSDCTLCFANAVFKGGLNPGVCLCDTGYFPDPTSDNCKPCDVSCLKCVGGSLTQCTSCKPNATIESKASQGKCLCDSGFFPDPTAGNCTPCHPTCKECQGATDTQCIECKDFAKFAGTAPCACLCSPEAFGAPDASNCKVCSLECLTCVADGPSKCLTCKSAASLLATAPNECVCNSGFYPSPDASMCAPCNPTCKKCSNEFECSMCKSYASLKDGNCVCDNGYYGNPDASFCLPCPDGCLLCAQTGCLKCKPLYFLYMESCVIECPFGYKPTPAFQCDALDMTSPVPSLTVTTDNTLSVFFSKPMNCTIAVGDVGLEVTTTDKLDVSFTWEDPEFQGGQTLLIAMVFESTYLPAGSKVGLTFIYPEKVTDEAGIPIDRSYLQGDLTAFGSLKGNSTGVLLQTPAAQTTAAASRGGVSAGAASSLINGNPACLMSLVNQLQLISYISMTKLPLPEDFASTLAALNVGQMLPNPFPNVFPSFSKNDTSQTPPQYVQDYGIGTTLFVPNSMTFLGTICVILLSFVPIYFLSKVKIRFVANYFKKMLPSLRWNVPLQLWFTSYLDLGVFSLLQMQNASNSMHSAFTGFSLVLAAVFCLCFSLTPALLIVFTLRNFNLISSRSNPVFNRRWGSLFLQFKNDYNFSTIAYYSLFILRRTILAVSLVLFPDSLTVLALLNTSCCLTVTVTQVFLYIVVCRPFEAKIDQIDALSVETSTFLVYLISSSFLLDLPSTIRDSLSMIGIWVVRAAIFVNVGVSIFRTVLNIVDLVKIYRDTVKAAEAKYRMRDVERIGKDETNEVTSMRDTRSTVNSYVK